MRPWDCVNRKGRPPKARAAKPIGPLARGLGRFAAGLVAVLWLAIVAGWVGGYRGESYASVPVGRWLLTGGCDPGRFWVVLLDGRGHAELGSWEANPTSPGELVSLFDRGRRPVLGIRWGAYRDRQFRGNGGRAWSMQVPPAWPASVLAGLLALCWGYLHGRRVRPEIGSCAGCGYDLRATPERCPECGRRPSVR